MLAVRDDDGGEDTESTNVRVVTPEQAVMEVIGLLDNVIAGTTNNVIRSVLQKARKALAGSIVNTSNNGALAKIKAGNNTAAITFLQEAIGWLQVAKAGGANVDTLITLLKQVSVALSAT